MKTTQPPRQQERKVSAKSLEQSSEKPSFLKLYQKENIPNDIHRIHISIASKIIHPASSQ